MVSVTCTLTVSAKPSDTPPDVFVKEFGKSIFKSAVSTLTVYGCTLILSASLFIIRLFHQELVGNGADKPDNNVEDGANECPEFAPYTGVLKDIGSPIS
jgi:hypothetical protein